MGPQLLDLDLISAYCLLLTAYFSLWLSTVTYSVPNADAARDNMAAD